MAKEYNGHRSWNAWNVALWINNEESLYNLAQEVCTETVKQGRSIDTASTKFIKWLGATNTPDGATYNRLCVKLAIRDIYDEVRKQYE